MQTINRSSVSAAELDQLNDALIDLPSSPATNILLSVIDQLRISNVSFFSELDELTTTQAAPLLGMSRPMVCRLVDSGELPARIVGRRDRRIPMSAICRYLERQARSAAGYRAA